jgi:hypothetical protein
MWTNEKPSLIKVTGSFAKIVHQGCCMSIFGQNLGLNAVKVLRTPNVCCEPKQAILICQSPSSENKRLEDQ